MNIKGLIHLASIAGTLVFIIATSADASTVTFKTNAAGVGDGAARLLTVNGEHNGNFGDFNLLCLSCSVSGRDESPTFDNLFTNPAVTEVTDDHHASGPLASETPAASDEGSNSIPWTPSTPIPAATTATGGESSGFGEIFQQATAPQTIVVPSSDSVFGSAIQGLVGTAVVPEPATASLIGGALLGLGLWRRKSFSRQ